MSRIFLIPLIALTVLIFAGCSRTPVSSIYKLTQFEPETVDLAELRAAVRVPEELRPKQVTLIIGARTHDTGPAQKQMFFLEPDPVQSNPPNLKKEAKPGTRHYVFRIAPGDMPQAERFRREIVAYRANGGSKGGGSLSVGADACRIGQLPAGRLLLTTYLKFDGRHGYFPVVRNIDMRSLVDENTLREKIPQCPA
ncbi:MAG: hypothetical protein MPJ78_08050 [Hyphomicrobiaceae bacterium]|nr:hypothetical protein [Hyphomicrobiaceae bacterium]